MEQKELNNILKNHETWLKSDGSCGIKADFSHENLAYVDLSNKNLVKANLYAANLTGANLVNTQLAWADLRKAKLNSANLSHADLTDANLSDAELSVTNLIGANLREAVLYGTKLWETILVRSSFIQSKWVGVDAYKLTLDEVDLSGAVLIGIRGIDEISYKKPNLSGIVTDGIFYSHIPTELRLKYEEGFVMVHKDAIVHTMAFPEELKEAGMSLLSYFHTVIEQKYPNENVSLTLRQDGLLVTMIVEPPTGEREKYENEFKKYTDVLKKEIPMQSYFTEREHIIRLENQLEIANAQVKTTEKILRLQDHQIRNQGNQIVYLDNKMDLLISTIHSVASKNILPPINIKISQLTSNVVDTDINNTNILNLVREIADELDELTESLDKNTAESDSIEQLKNNIKSACDNYMEEPYNCFAWIHKLGEYIESLKAAHEHVESVLSWGEKAHKSYLRLIVLYNKVANILTLTEI